MPRAVAIPQCFGQGVVIEVEAIIYDRPLLGAAMRGSAIGDRESAVAAILGRVMTGIGDKLSPVFRRGKLPARPLPVERVRVTSEDRSLIREVCDGVVTVDGESLGRIDSVDALCLRHLARCGSAPDQR